MDNAETPGSGTRKQDMRNELLYFVQNKCHALAMDNIVNICAEFYNCSEIDAARVLLAEHSGRRLSKPKGGTDKEKRDRTMVDIVKTCVDPDIALPLFYSLDMARIPSVGVEHIDVSALVQEVAALRAEVRSFAAARLEIADIRASLSAIGASIPAASPDNQEVASSSLPSTGDTDLGIATPASAQSITTRAPAHQKTGLVTSIGQSYADKAEVLRATGMASIPQDQNARKPKPSPVIGRSTGTSRVKAVVTKRQIDMFVSRLSPDTDDVDVLACVMNVMSDRYCDNVKCNRLQSKHEDLYSSYHVAVTVDSMHMRHAIELLNNPDHWPEGLIARRYFRPKSNG